MKAKFSILTLALLPFLAKAQPFIAANPAGATNSQGFAATIDGFIGYLLYLAGRALPLLILAALVMFLFGIFQIFFLKKGADAADNKGRNFILWGIVGLFVMVSVWGLVNVVRDTLRLDNSRVPAAPAIPFPAAPATGPGGNVLQ